MGWINDGGHGGSDPGTSANGLVEKTLTLEAAKYVNARLKAHGIKSAMTRTSDVTLTQNQRTSKVKKCKYCISHHFNAGGGNGVELIRSIYSDGKFENDVIAEFRKAGYPIRPKPVFTRKGSNGKDYYFMHWDTGACRTTIVEYDFLDGPNAKKLKDKKYREGMYECVIRAICKQEKVKYKSVKKKSKSTPKKEVKQVSNKPSAWAKKDVKEAIAVGITDGSRLHDTATRQEVIVMINRARKLK